LTPLATTKTLRVALSPTPLERALSGAPVRATAQAARPEREFFFFRVDKLILGVGSESVREVIRLGPLTPLPRMAAFVLGVVGHRGEVLPVIDLLRFLGQGEMHPNPRTRLFVGLAGSWSAAFLADEVMGLVRVPLEHILPPPVGAQLAGDQVLGIYRRQKENRTATLLDLSRVFAAARQRAVVR
jgi:purine-binding chemotaxis protein CheW